jgi:galactokinase
MADLQTLFKRQFNAPPTHSVRVPGWLPLLGADTEAQEGLVLAAAVEPCLHMAFTPRTDGKIELACAGQSQRDLFWVNDLKLSVPWADPVKAVLKALSDRGVHFLGFSAAILDETPPAAAPNPGVALAMATLLAVRRLYPFTLTQTGLGTPPQPNAKGRLPAPAAQEKWLLAHLCRDALASVSDNKPPSLVGPLCLLFGKAWHLLTIDLRFQTLEALPFVGEAFVVCETTEKSTPAPLTWDSLCVQTAQKLRAKSLRSVAPEWLESNRSCLSPAEYACAWRVAGELQRAVAAERALREDDHRQLGQYLIQSQQESPARSTPEAGRLLALAQAHPACLGARLCGNSLVSLIPFHQVEPFMAHLTATANPPAGHTPPPIVCRTAEAL